MTIKKRNGTSPSKVANGVSHKTGGSGKTNGKRQYRRSTPIGRVKKHVAKAMQLTTLSISRMQGWQKVRSDNHLEVALELAHKAALALSDTFDRLEVLVKRNWTPPSKPTTVNFDEGDEVTIAGKYSDRYLQIYPVSVLKALVVTKVLPGGGIAVKHGDRSPFIVAKSHLEKRRSEGHKAASKKAEKHTRA
jgi:hypothetical protein